MLCGLVTAHDGPKKSIHGEWKLLVGTVTGRTRDHVTPLLVQFPDNALGSARQWDDSRTAGLPSGVGPRPYAAYLPRFTSCKVAFAVWQSING